MSVLAMPSATTRALHQLSEALEAIGALVPDHGSRADQEALVRGLELAGRRLEASRLQALEAFARGGGWDDGHHLSPATWVRDELATARGDAGRDLSLGRALRDWPSVAAAFADGRISARSAGVVCSALSRLPDVDEQTVAMVLAAAQVCDPLTLARELAARVAAAAPEQAQADADEVHDRRRLHLAKTFEGLGRLDAWLDPELAELFGDALDAELSRDRAADDDRTIAKRRHDAFGRLIRRAVTAPDAPQRHGAPVQLLVLAPAETVKRVPGAAPARTAGGHVLTRGAFDRLSCNLLLLLCEGHHHALHDRERTLPLKDGRTLTPTGAYGGTDPPGG